MFIRTMVFRRTLFSLCLLCLTAAQAPEGNTDYAFSHGSVSGNSLLNKSIASKQDIFDAMSIEAEQTLIDIREEFSKGNVTDAPVPLYRLDLDKDYIAYWEVTSDTGDFVIISAGPLTGDSKLVAQSSLPSRTQDMQTLAANLNEICVKYFIVSYEGDLVCANDKGVLVATTLSWSIIFSNETTPTDEPQKQVMLLSWLTDHQDELKTMWAEKAKRSASHWKDQWVMTEAELKDLFTSFEMSNFSDDMALDEGGEQSVNMIHEIELREGDRVQVALSDIVGLRYVEIIALSGGDHKQDDLCKIIPVCQNVTNTLVSEHAVHVDPETGLKILDFMVRDAQLFGIDETEIDFLVIIHRGNDEVVLRQYGLELTHERRKRRTETKSWTNWSSYNIPCYHLFPNYDQHNVGRCAVGCGPVAWAMIFGYLDRAAHNRCKSKGTELWRCGSDGFSGCEDECQAPYRNTAAVKEYTEKLNDIMETWCVATSGLTWPNNMVKVSNFYKERVSNGRIITKNPLKFWESNADWTRARIREGWPVVILYKFSWLSWHYPVVTGYKERSRQYRNCVWFMCGSWKTDKEYKMILNQGWGGYRNGEYDMDIWLAGAAVY